MNLNSLLPQNSNTTQNAASIALEKKWSKTGLLEGLNGEVERRGMAVLLENQAKQLVTEANATGTTAGSEEWNGVALPLVRRIFAEIAAKDFVSVQPMNLPSGLVFFLDFKYGTNQGANGFGTSTGNDFLTGQGRKSQADSVFGITDAGDGGTDINSGTAGTEGHYGAGRFGYTINDVNVVLGASDYNTGSYNPFTNTFSSNKTALTGAQLDLFTNFNSEFSASAAASSKAFQVVQVNTGSLSGFDKNGVRAFNVSGSGITTIYPEFTKLKGASIYLLAETAATPAIAVAAASVEVAYHKGPADNITRGDFEDPTAGASLDIPEINLEMRSEAIVAKTRKLKAIWSPEFAQDLNAYHSIDAEAELTSMLSEYISQEIDLEI
jgi:hypothetical protein